VGCSLDQAKLDRFRSLMAEEGLEAVVARRADDIVDEPEEVRT
jgi:hypothetical protein